MNSSTILVIYVVGFFALMYFLTIRPQQKQQKQKQALLSSLRVRDKVITTSGIYGKITKIKETTVMLQIADKVEIEVSKAAVASVENRDITLEKDSKDKKEGKDKKDTKEKDNVAGVDESAEAEKSSEV